MSKRIHLKKMSTLKKTALPSIVAVFAASSIGCSPTDAALENTDGESDMLGEVASGQQALLYPAQVTGVGGASAGAVQGETQVGFSYASDTDSVQVVTYNDKSNVDGASGIFGWAYNDPLHSTGWVVHKKAAPSPFISIWGDAGLAVNPYSSNRYTYISNMGQLFSASGGLDSICVARFDRTKPRPQAGSWDSPNLSCYYAGNVIDGTSIAAGGTNGTVVVGYQNRSTFQIDLWSSCTGGTCGPTKAFSKNQAPWIPFPGESSETHPQILIDNDTGIIYVAAVLNTQLGDILFFNWAWLGGFQSAPTAVALDPYIAPDPGQSLTTLPSTGNKASLSYPARGFSMALGKNSANATVLRFAYTVRETSDNRFHIRYATCTTFPNVSTPFCNTAAPWSTVNYSNPSNPSYKHDEYSPAIAYGQGSWKAGFITSYAGTNSLSVGYQSLSENNGTFQNSPPFVVANTSNVLPGNTSIHCDEPGDYNHMAYNLSHSNFIYTYSRQQTGTTCDTEARGHVYEAVIPF